MIKNVLFPVKAIVLIPIHNGINETLKCLESLYNSTYLNFDVIIIDDGSSDNSSYIIREKYGLVKIIKGDGNLWWSGGMNAGISLAIDQYKDEDIVILLNNDNIVEPDMLKCLVEGVKRNPKSIICSKVFIEGDNNRVLFAGGYASIKKSGLYIKGYYELDSPELNTERNVEWCGGMGVAIPIHIIKKIGYFDNKNFPQYFGDADYMYRARKEGYKIIFDAKSICWNNREQTGYSVKSAINIDVIKKLLFNIKSNYELKRNFKFYYRHFNIFKATSILFIKYMLLFLSFFY